MVVKSWIYTFIRINVDPYITPIPKINPKLIRDLNVTAKIVTLLEENLGVYLHTLEPSNGFLDMALKA